MTFLANFNNFVHGSFVVTVEQIKKNCVVEKRSVLWNDGYFLSESKPQILDILSIKQYLTFIWVDNPEKHVHNG